MHVLHNARYRKIYEVYYMIDSLDYGDIATNQSYGKGSVRCHGNTDIALTATGDIALTTDAFSNLRQRMMMYIMTPKGERLDPDLGCVLWDFFFEKDRPEELRLFELTLENDIRTAFPDLDLKGIRIISSGNDSVGRTTTAKVILGNEDLEFVFPRNDITDVSKQFDLDIFRIW